MSNGKKYTKLVHTGNMIRGAHEVRVLEKFEPGTYTVGYNQDTSEVFLIPSTTTHDRLLNLPGTEYDSVMQELRTFLSKESRDLFKEWGDLYKASWLLYGRPGTGKTCISNRVAQEVIAAGGIVLQNPEPALIPEVYHLIRSVQPDLLTLTVLEEVDSHVNRNKEEHLLHALDGECQKDNSIVIGTTNYIENIPTRLLRPGRFGNVIEVREPSPEARLSYMQHKLPNAGQAVWDQFVEASDGMTIDELHALVRNVRLLKQDMASVVSRIKSVNGLGGGKKIPISPQLKQVAVAIAEELKKDTPEKEETPMKIAKVGK